MPTDFTEAESQDVEWDGRDKPPVHRRFILQFSKFPFMAHDDMVDAGTQALTRLIKLVTGDEPRPDRKITRFVRWYPDMWEDFEQMSELEQQQFIATYGAPLEWADY